MASPDEEISVNLETSFVGGLPANLSMFPSAVDGDIPYPSSRSSAVPAIISETHSISAYPAIIESLDSTNSGFGFNGDGNADDGNAGGVPYPSSASEDLTDASVLGSGIVRRGRGAAFLDRVSSALGRAGHNLTHDKNGLAFGVGYSAMSIGQGYSQLQSLNEGQYVTPEQYASADYNTIVPGASGIIGTVIGTALGGAAGGLAGQFIGGAIGQGASAAFTASEDRAQATREASERLAASLGSVTESLATFKSQIEATGAPTAQLQQTLSIASGMGTGSASNTVAGIGALTNAFQERAVGDFSLIGKYVSDPLMYRVGNRFSTGAADSGDLLSLGFDAAEQGNFGDLVSFQQMARDATTKSDPQYQKLAAQQTQNKQSWWQQANHWLTSEGDSIGLNRLDRFFGINDDANDATTTTQGKMDARQQQLSTSADPAIAAQNALINQFAAIRSDQIVSESGIKSASAGIGLVTAQGGSAAQIGAASTALYGSLSAARASTQSEIGLLQADLANPVNAGRKDELTARIADAQARLTGYDVTDATQRRSVFDTSLGEEQATFGFFATRDTLRGDSAAAMQGGFNRQAEFLEGTAANPRNPLSPTERAGIEESAARLRYTAAQNLYGEENAGLGVTRAGREGDISRATFLGTPLQAYDSQIAGLQSDRDQIAQNNSELSRGNLTNAQRLGLTTQIAGLQADLDTGPERARRSFYGAEDALLTGQQSGDQAFLSRNVSSYGSSAYTPQVFADDRSRISSAYQDFASSPTGSVAQATAYGQYQNLLADDAQKVTNSQIYRETSTQRTQDNQVEGAFNRAMIAPYLNGPESNPLTAGNAALSNLRSRLGEAERYLSNATDPLAREQDSALVESYKDRIADLEHRRYSEMFSALPESISGAPGSALMAGIVPTAAMTARFTANPIFGSFGAPGPMPTSGVGAIQPGGAAGAFASGSGASNIEALLTKLIMVVQSNGGKLAPPAPYSGAGAVSDTLGRTFNPARPPQ